MELFVDQGPLATLGHYTRPGRYFTVDPVVKYIPTPDPRADAVGITATSIPGPNGLTERVDIVVHESIAQEAHRLVLGDRGKAYGHPIFDMTRSADMLTSLLRDKLKPGVRLEAEDIGQAMICVKQSRHRNAPKRDNMTDTAGYALTLQMIKEWRDANPGVDPRDRF